MGAVGAATPTQQQPISSTLISRRCRGCCREAWIEDASIFPQILEGEAHRAIPGGVCYFCWLLMAAVVLVERADRDRRIASR